MPAGIMVEIGASRPRMTAMSEVDQLSNPEQPRIARLDLFSHFLDALRILLHQLDVGNLPPSRLRLHLRVNRILRGEVAKELLGFTRMQPGLEQFCGVGVLRGLEDAGRPGNRRRTLTGYTGSTGWPASFNSTMPYSLPSAITARSPSDSFFGGSVDDCTCITRCFEASPGTPSQVRAPFGTSRS